MSPGLVASQSGLKILEPFDVVPSDLKEHVSRLQPGALGRATGHHAAQHHASAAVCEVGDRSQGDATLGPLPRRPLRRHEAVSQRLPPARQVIERLAHEAAIRSIPGTLSFSTVSLARW